MNIKDLIDRMRESIEMGKDYMKKIKDRDDPLKEKESEKPDEKLLEPEDKV